TPSFDSMVYRATVSPDGFLHFRSVTLDEFQRARSKTKVFTHTYGGRKPLTPRAASPRAAPAVQAARPQPPVLSVRCGASRRPAGGIQRWPAAGAGVRADPRRGQHRPGGQQGGMGGADAGGGKGGLLFLSPQEFGVAISRPIVHNASFAIA